jgi:DNA modification methylase
MKNLKYIDNTWDFRNDDVKYLTHCIHNYPAMMIPQIANRIIEKYGSKAKTLFDPYCGTGTSLLEANLSGINAIGTDVNPLARLISKVKTTIIPIDETEKFINNLQDSYLLNSFSGDSKLFLEYVPNTSNLDFWFSKEVKACLSQIKKFIYEIKNTDIKDFFKVAFSETVRECSWTRNSEFKLYRIPKETLDSFNPDVFKIFIKKILRNLKGIKELQQVKKNKNYSQIFDFDTVQGLPLSLFENQNIDLVVTSPPYGDSRTTVAYGQYSKLSSDWLDFSNTNQIDKKIMGGTLNKEISKFAFNKLDSAITQIRNSDLKRSQEVYSFFRDYEISIQNISKVMLANSIAAYVVGNRKVKGVTIPMDEATVYFFEKAGFQHLETIVREIPNKRMPSKNSPSNEIGKVENTMLNEYIVIMKKK